MPRSIVGLHLLYQRIVDELVKVREMVRLRVTWQGISTNTLQNISKCEGLTRSGPDHFSSCHAHGR